MNTQSACSTHGTLCLCQWRGGTLAIFIVLFVPEKGWNSGYIHCTLCARDGMELWLYSCSIGWMFMHYRDSGQYSWTVSLAWKYLCLNLEQTRDITMVTRAWISRLLARSVECNIQWWPISDFLVVAGAVFYMTVHISDNEHSYH